MARKNQGGDTTPELRCNARNPRGSTGVENSRGRLRIRLPRKITDVNRYIYLDLADTPENRLVAERIARQIDLDVLAGHFDPSLKRYRPIQKSETLELKDLWQRFTQHRARELEVSTIIRDYGKIARILERMPRKTDPKAVREWLLQHYSYEVTRRILKALGRCHEWATLMGYVETNTFSEVAQGMKPVRGTGRSRQAFTRLELNTILEAIKSDRFCSKYSPIKHSFYYSFVKFLSLTGCRLEEAIALKWEHIESDHIFIREAIPTDVKVCKDTKTHSNRKFPINPQLRDLLASQTSSQRLVFTSPTGKVIDCHNLLPRLWKPVVGALVGLGEVRQYLPLYNIRHSVITHWIKEGIPIHQIAYWVGNSPEVLLKHYASVIEGMLPPEF